MRQLPGIDSPIIAKDGDTVVLIVETPGPTAFDPADVRPYVSQAYRIVADRTAPTLVLVPLSETPVRASREAVNRMNDRILGEVKSLIGNHDFVARVIPPCGGKPVGGSDGK